MVHRIYDPDKIHNAIVTILKDPGRDTTEWRDNPDNIVLENENGDLALFEKGFMNKIYSGHYFFNSRGRGAIEAGKAFLDELFNTCYNIEVMTGMVPLQHLGARWMSRKLGFTSHGVEHLKDQHYELFILTKKEFNNGPNALRR